MVVSKERAVELLLALEAVTEKAAAKLTDKKCLTMIQDIAAYAEEDTELEEDLYNLYAELEDADAEDIELGEEKPAKKSKKKAPAKSKSKSRKSKKVEEEEDEDEDEDEEEQEDEDVEEDEDEEEQEDEDEEEQEDEDEDDEEEEEETPKRRGRKSKKAPAKSKKAPAKSAKTSKKASKTKKPAKERAPRTDSAKALLWQTWKKNKKMEIGKLMKLAKVVGRVQEKKAKSWISGWARGDESRLPSIAK